MPYKPSYSVNLGTVLKGAGIAILATLILWYVHFQARNFLKGPVIVLNDAQTVLHHEKSIPISGVTQNIVKLTLNGREITTDKEGNFSHTLILENGYSIATLAAEDRFGRKTTITQEYVYAPL